VTLDAPLRIGISACLLGDEVRYDGGHKRDAFLTGVLGPFVEWVKVCPEVEIGMGTPREPIRLTAHDGRIRLLAVKSGTDYTDRASLAAALPNLLGAERAAPVQSFAVIVRKIALGNSLRRDGPG